MSPSGRKKTASGRPGLTSGTGERNAKAAVRRFTEGKEVRKVVYVPNRLLNLVVGSRDPSVSHREANRSNSERARASLTSSRGAKRPRDLAEIGWSQSCAWPSLPLGDRSPTQTQPSHALRSSSLNRTSLSGESLRPMRCIMLRSEPK